MYWVPVFLFLFLSGYYAAKKVISSRSNRVIQKAIIDKIQLQQAGNIWLPELNVAYFFLFNSKIYNGNGVVRIDHLLPNYHLLLYDRNGYPVLQTEAGEFIGEEHIETFILENKKEILVEFNLITLPHSRIFNIGGDQRPTLQSTDIQFPWT
jgi:hypothetical protein